VALASIVFIVVSPIVVRGLRVDADLGRLIGASEPAARAYLTNRTVFGETDHLLVVLDCADASREACDRVAGGLTNVLRTWPDIRSVESPQSPSPDLLALALRAALVAGGPGEIGRFSQLFTPDGMKSALAQTRRRLVLADDPGARDLLSSDVLGVGRLFAGAPWMPPGSGPFGPGPLAAVAPDTARLLVVRPGGPSDDSAYCLDLTARLDGALAGLTRSHPDAATIEYAYSGVHAITSESAAVLNRELAIITVAAALLTVGLVWLAFRRGRLVLLCAVPLGLATAAVLVMARAFFNPVSFLAVGFAGIVVGLGVDSGIHLTYRLLRTPPALSGEERVRRTLTECGRPILVAAATTVAAFCSLVLARNAGVAQLGLLSGLGLMLTAVLTLAVFPAAVRLFDSAGRPGGGSTGFGEVAAGPGLAAIQHPIATLVIGALVLVTGLAATSRLEIDRDIYQIVPAGLDARRAAVAAASRFGISAAPAVQVSIQGGTYAEAMRAQQDLDRRLADLVAAGRVAVFSSPSALLPAPDEFARVRAHLDAAHAAIVSGRQRFLAALTEAGFRIDEQYDRYLALLERAADTSGLDPDGRPRDEASLVHAGQVLATLDGRPRLLTTLWPAVGIDQSGPVQTAAAADVSSDLLAGDLLPGVSVEATGALQVFGRLNERLLDDFARVTGIGLALAGAVTVLHFRSASAALLAALPLTVALLVSLGLVSALGWSIAPPTVLFAAIVVGLGVDSSIHMLAHAGRAPDWDPERAVREAGPPVVLSTLTTAVGFSALALSSVPVISSLGAVVAIAALCCGLSALMLLPAVLSLLRRRGGARGLAVVLLFSLAFPAAGLAQSPADRILERLQQRYEDAEALSCEFEQTKTIRQLVAPIRVQGSAVFQRPMFLRMELTGDEAVTVYSNSQRVWIVDGETGSVDEFDLAALPQNSGLLRMVPTVFLGDFADLRARFEAGIEPGSDGRRLTLTARRADEACRQIGLEIDSLDRPRWVLMRFANGDQVETRFQAWSRRPRISDAWFAYQPPKRDRP